MRQTINLIFLTIESTDGRTVFTDRRNNADGVAQDPAAGRGPRQGLGKLAATRTQDLSSRHHEGTPAHQGHLRALQGKEG